MAFQSLHIFAHLLLAITIGETVSVTTKVQDQSYVEIGARSFEVKRLMREDATPVSKADSEHAAADRDTDAEIAVDSVLDKTIHFMHHRKPAVLLSGPGIPPQNKDPFAASVETMHDLSKDMSFDCSAQYGERMLDKLMEDRFEHHLCSGNRSTITCHERYPFDCPRYMCELKNVMLSRDGTTVADCKKSGDFDGFFKKQGATEHRVFGADTKFGGVHSADGVFDCKHHVSSNALVQVPDDVNNFYEWYGEWVTLWESLAAMKWNPKNTILYLLIKSPFKTNQSYSRPFDEAWERAFKGGRVYMGTRDELFGDGTCFSNLVTVPNGKLSTVSFQGGRGGVVACSSPIVMSSALYLQALFPPVPPAIAGSDDGASKSKQLTLILRKGRRKFENDVVAINAIKQVLPSDWSMSVFRPEDMEDFSSQLGVIANTNVFVGVHGAGMMHVLFLPPKARVVEIFCDDRPRENHHFRNLEMMAEPAVGGHLFSYYFEASSQRCKVDRKAVKDAITAYEKGLEPAPSVEA